MKEFLINVAFQILGGLVGVWLYFLWYDFKENRRRKGVVEKLFRETRS